LLKRLWRDKSEAIREAAIQARKKALLEAARRQEEEERARITLEAEEEEKRRIAALEAAAAAAAAAEAKAREKAREQEKKKGDDETNECEYDEGEEDVEGEGQEEEEEQEEEDHLEDDEEDLRALRKGKRGDGREELRSRRRTKIDNDDEDEFDEEDSLQSSPRRLEAPCPIIAPCHPLVMNSSTNISNSIQHDSNRAVASERGSGSAIFGVIRRKEALGLNVSSIEFSQGLNQSQITSNNTRINNRDINNNINKSFDLNLIGNNQNNSNNNNNNNNKDQSPLIQLANNVYKDQRQTRSIVPRSEYAFEYPIIQRAAFMRNLTPEIVRTSDAADEVMLPLQSFPQQ
jgi:hypothetical protein